MARQAAPAGPGAVRGKSQKALTRRQDVVKLQGGVSNVCTVLTPNTTNLTREIVMPYKDTSVRRARDRARYRANPDLDRVKHANRRARAYGAPSTITVEDVRAAMNPGKCHYCGSDYRLGIDHVVPLHAGGENTRANIAAACGPCNSSKERADRPGRWSQMFDACRECGRADRAHNAGGLCNTCYAGTKKPKVGRWHGQKLTIDAARQIRGLWDEGETPIKTLAAEFGVHTETIKNIISGRTWKDPQ